MRYSLNSERQSRQEPQQRSDAHSQAAAQHLGKDAAHLDADSAEGHGKETAHTDCTREEPKSLQQDSRHKTAHSAVQSRSDKWAQTSCSSAENVQELQSKGAVHLGSRQASLLKALCNAPLIWSKCPGTWMCEVECP